MDVIFSYGKVKDWRADFDFLINVNNATKVLEGKYTSTRKKKQEETTSNPFLKIMLEEEGYDTKGNARDTSSNEGDVSEILSDYTIE